jgi:hypothetical protein
VKGEYDTTLIPRGIESHSRTMILCLGGNHCNHLPGRCTANPEPVAATLTGMSDPVLYTAIDPGTLSWGIAFHDGNKVLLEVTADGKLVIHDPVAGAEALMAEWQKLGGKI